MYSSVGKDTPPVRGKIVYPVTIWQDTGTLFDSVAGCQVFTLCNFGHLLTKHCFMAHNGQHWLSSFRPIQLDLYVTVDV